MRIIAKDDDEAERIIAVIWLELERNKIPAPFIKIARRSSALLINLLFEQQNHEELVRKEALSTHMWLRVV